MAEPIDLTEKFPEMQPVKSAPAMFTVNGCGLSMWGRREFDAETGTYLKTWCLVFLFLPVFCFRTYRVADAPNRGWYFLGREPVSLFAKMWNLFLLSCIGGGFTYNAWLRHTQSPEYIAAQKMEAAHADIAAGQWQKAFHTLHDVAMGSTSHSTQAFTEFQELAAKEVSAADLPTVTDSVRLASSLKARGGPDFVTRLIHEISAPAIDRHGEKNPVETRSLLPVIEPLIEHAKDPGASRKWFDQTKRKLLETAFVFTPNPPLEIVVELAAVLEEENNLERCEQILSARKTELGTTEGARILGQIYAGRGELDEAYSLLMPYMQIRLNDLQSVNQQLEQRLKFVQDQAIRDLEQGQGPPSFYARYDSAGEDLQHELVNNFLMERIAADEQIKDLEQKSTALGTAVPAAIDLGIIQLRRGQAESDPGLRRQELEQAEKTFLAVRGQLGETDTYRMFLGQVYFWMGRQDEGKKLFEELLASSRTQELMLQIAGIYREVGSVSDARLLAEEAYQSAADDQQRDSAAGLRAVMHTGVEDQIAWLEKCSQNSAYTKVSLAQARGEKAELDGNDVEAARHYQETIDGYQQLPESSSSLNNVALVLFRLAIINSDSASFDRGLEKLERAIALEPDNSILLLNATDAIEKAVIVAVVGNRLDFERTGISKSFDVFSWFYNDLTGLESLANEVRGHPGIRRVIDNFEKLTVLSPRSKSAWLNLTRIYRGLDDNEKQRSLLDRLRTTPLDHAGDAVNLEQYRRGQLDQLMRTAAKTSEAKHRKYLDAVNGEHDVASACVAGELIDSHETLARIGDSIDYESDLALAMAIYEAVPSSGARSALMGARCRLAIEKLKSQSPVLEDVLNRYRREAHAELILLIALIKDPSLRDPLVQSPEIKGWIEDLRRQMELFPESASAIRYQLLSALGETDLVEQLKKRLLDKADSAVEVELTLLLYPSNVAAACEAWWYSLLVGNQALTEKSLADVPPELNLREDLGLEK